MAEQDFKFEDVYKRQVLTSRGIQKRYFEAVSRRKSLEVDYNILLVECAQICPNVNISSRNVNIFSKNADIRRHSRVEESRAVSYTHLCVYLVHI